MLNNWLNRFCYRHPKWGIHNLMYYISGGMAILYLCSMLAPLYGVLDYFYLYRSAVLQGQVWRIISFIFLPTSTSSGLLSPLLFAISLYFYIFIASTLERQWGALKFNIYYAIGVIGCIISAMITGYASNIYLNLSLFLAFAALYPEFKVMLFFFIPVKMKVLAYIDLGIYGTTLTFALLAGDWTTISNMLFSLVGLVLFFGGDYINRIRNYFKTKARRAKFKRDMNNINYPL